MSCDSVSDVSGPVAMISGNIDGSSGMRGTSSRTTVISGCAWIASVIACENRSRSTASAAPAGTRCASAARMHERAEPPHLLLQQADGVIELVAAKRVGADQLGETIGLVHGGRTHRPHLVQHDAHAERGRLPGGLGAREPAADDVDCLHGSMLNADMLKAQRMPSLDRPSGFSGLPRGTPLRFRRARLSAAFRLRRRGEGAAPRRAASSSSACA